MNYLAIQRIYGPARWHAFAYNHGYYNYGYFVGRWLGSYVLPALGVLLYYKIRRKSPSGPAQFSVISAWAAILPLLAFLGARPRSPEALIARRIAEQERAASIPPPRTAAATKWDPAIHSFYEDVRAFQERYATEVSKLDAAALPLYTPDSFKDAPRIQQAISQLQARLQISRQFSSPETLLTKMPEYAGKIDATESERKTFLAGFNASAKKDLAQRKTLGSMEQDWLQASLSVYRFTLGQQGAYTASSEAVVFNRKGAGEDFNRKLEIAKLGRLEFLQAYRQYVRMQNASLAQYGLPRLSISGAPSATVPATAPTR